MNTLRKASAILVVFALLITSISAFASAEEIMIDNELVTIPEGMGKVCEIDGRTFVPIRFLSEYLGCDVNYDDAQESATITDSKSGLSYFVICSNPALSDKLYVLPAFGDGTVIQMDAHTFINNDEARMYIPVRFFAQALNFAVDWIEETETVALISIASDNEAVE